MIHSANTKARSRLSEKQRGPSNRRARNASAALENFVRHPPKDFFNKIRQKRTFLNAAFDNPQPGLNDRSAGSSQIAGRDGPCASVSRTAASAAAAFSGRAF